MAAEKIDKLYETAIADLLLPGVSLIAGDKNGNILYSKSFGKASQRPGRQDEPFTAESTIAAIASMSKLMTAVAVLKGVELGKLDLDVNMRPVLPGMGQRGILTGFDDQKNVGVIQSLAADTPITLRMLLSCTSGIEYDFMNPDLEKWRASRNEIPWSGPTVEDKSAGLLTSVPGTRFAYSGGADWAGKAIETVFSTTLEDFMHRHIWKPLGIENHVAFWPEKRPDMKDRIATFSTLTELGEPPVKDEPDFDIRFGGTDCLGSGGIFSTAKAYYTFLSALFRRDERLLTESSYTELFRPQLDEKLEQSFNDYLVQSPAHTQFLGMAVPANVRKTWSFAGMVCLDAEPGRFEKGTILWGGVPCCTWFMDFEGGVCGTAVCQVLPPMHPVIVGGLHAKFQRHVLEITRDS
ncbi:beta-lactamase/transpeptidase-like protein [Rhypophila decipiens]|uniref:Beta-lactamase/transpeptidase-like protein n=1 Tax=Rhypophila decipiens TaxID=261697 RepID=A0AAN6YCA8_9PEZI|nr:beta-lactamase/transpeptidase-like protein [Rhypophila decipiens]